MAITLSDVTNRIMSASATLIALVALGTGLYQAKLSRDQAKAAVWPYLISGNSGESGYSRVVQNVGLGPAIIGAFEVQVDSVPVHSWKEAAESLHVQLTFTGSRSTTFRRGLVVPVAANIHLIELPDSADIRLVRSRTKHLRTYICYCSLYGDCWMLDSYLTEPTKVKVCVDDPLRAFRE
ncbi:MAG: hypothetical protein M3Z05_13550 [Gemmatimonadota bacterium]|nr:hypothetical protein [Gemmatimonadota bacterium]